MASDSSHNDSPLTEAQWAGLARLGDLGNRLGALLDGPLAGPATAGLDRLGELGSRYDFETLGVAVLDLVEALHRAGLLRLWRDNAEFIGSSIETLAPVLSEWIEQAARMPLDDTRADIAALLRWMHRLRVFGEFVETELSSELASGAVDLTTFLQQNDTEPALREAAVQLGRIYRSGLLARLGEASEWIAGTSEDISLESLAGGLVRGAPANMAVRLARLLRGLEEAMAAAERGEVHLGGLGGLLHLLRDKDVQKGLYVLSVMSLSLSDQATKQAQTA